MHVRLRPEMDLIADGFSKKIRVTCELVLWPYSEHKPLSMAVYFHFLGELKFVGAQVKASNAKFDKL